MNHCIFIRSIGFVSFTRDIGYLQLFDGIGRLCSVATLRKVSPKRKRRFYTCDLYSVISKNLIIEKCLSTDWRGVPTKIL
jgi:hypothetical protein